MTNTNETSEGIAAESGLVEASRATAEKSSTVGDAAKMREALESLIFACDIFEQALEYDLDGHYDIIPGYVNYAHDFITRVNIARAVFKNTKGEAE